MSLKKIERAIAILAAIFLLSLEMAVSLAAFSSVVEEPGAAATPELRKITFAIKILEITASDTRILAEPKVTTLEGEKATISQGKTIPWKRPDGETVRLMESWQLELTPIIVSGQGIRITLAISTSSPDPKTGTLVESHVKKEALCRNLELLTLELMEKEDKSSRLAIQFAPLIEPRKDAAPSTKEK